MQSVSTWAQPDRQGWLRGSALLSLWPRLSLSSLGLATLARALLATQLLHKQKIFIFLIEID